MPLESYSQNFQTYFTVQGADAHLMLYSSAGAAVGTRCTYSCTCSREKQGRVLRGADGLTGDILVLWCVLKKTNKSSAATITITFSHQNCSPQVSGHFLQGHCVFYCSPLHCCRSGAAIRLWYSPKCLHPHPSPWLWFYDRCLCSAALGILSCPVALGANLAANRCQSGVIARLHEEHYLESHLQGMLASVCQVDTCSAPWSGRVAAFTWLRGWHSTALGAGK